MKVLSLLVIISLLLGISLCQVLPVGIVLTEDGSQNDSKSVDLVLSAMERFEYVQVEMGLNITQFDFVEEEGNMFYDVVAFKERKVLGLFPVNVESKIRINASDGQIIRHTKPWWHFLSI